MKKQKNANSNPVQEKVETKVFPFFIIGCIFICLSLFAFLFSDEIRIWGLNYIKFFPTWTIALFYLLLLCFLLPPLGKIIAQKVAGLNRIKIIAFAGKHKYLWFALISITFGFLFYLLKIKYIFLGDLDLRPKQIEEGHIINDEYLTMLFFKYAHQILHSKFEFTGINTVRLFDYVTGALFIFISLCISNLIGNTFLKKLSVFIVSTLSLTILLQFCGYTEIYAIPVLFLNLYLFTCLLNLQGKVGIYLPFITLLIGTGFHLLMVCMIPSLFFLFYRNGLWKYAFFRQKKVSISILVLLLPFAYVAINRFAVPKMFPFSTNDPVLITMFSTAHFVEFFNSQLLASGIGFLIWIALLLYSLINRIKYNPTHWFLFISSLSITGLMFVFNAHRGSGDWDILAFASIVFNLFNAYFLISLHDGKLCNNIKYGIVIVSVFSILHTSAWIVTNKTDISIEWLERAFVDDPAHYYRKSLNNEAMVAEILVANKMEERAIKWYKLAYQKYPNDPRMSNNYSHQLFMQGKLDEAKVILENSVNKFPNYPSHYILLINIYIAKNDHNALYALLLKMEEAYNKNTDGFNKRLTKDQIDQCFLLLNGLRGQQPK